MSLHVWSVATLQRRFHCCGPMCHDAGGHCHWLATLNKPQRHKWWNKFCWEIWTRNDLNDFWLTFLLMLSLSTCGTSPTSSPKAFSISDTRQTQRHMTIWNKSFLFSMYIKLFFTWTQKKPKAKPVRMWSILLTTRSASSTVKHMGGLNLSTLRWGPSALSRMYCSFSLRWTSSLESIRAQLEWDDGLTNEIQIMHLLINDFLGLGCCRREFCPILHKLNANKEATTPARGNVP